MLDEFALVGLARNDGLAFERDVTIVEAEFGLPIVFVVPMADVAVLGKDGPNIAIELDFVGCGCKRGNAHKQCQSAKQSLRLPRNGTPHP